MDVADGRQVRCVEATNTTHTSLQSPHKKKKLTIHTVFLAVQGCNCFLLAEYNGFQQPSRYFVFRADSTYDKQLWLRHLRETREQVANPLPSPTQVS